jgi:hypothetical protein
MRVVGISMHDIGDVAAAARTELPLLRLRGRAMIADHRRSGGSDVQAVFV